MTKLLPLLIGCVLWSTTGYSQVKLGDRIVQLSSYFEQVPDLAQQADIEHSLGSTDEVERILAALLLARYQPDGYLRVLSGVLSVDDYDAQANQALKLVAFDNLDAHLQSSMRDFVPVYGQEAVNKYTASAYLFAVNRAEQAWVLMDKAERASIARMVRLQMLELVFDGQPIDVHTFDEQIDLNTQSLKAKGAMPLSNRQKMAARPAGCADLHDGYFYTEFNDGSKVHIQREGDQQVEQYDGDVLLYFKVEWVSDCTYLLTSVGEPEAQSVAESDALSRPLRCNIFEIKPEEYDCICLLEGQTEYVEVTVKKADTPITDGTQP